MEQTSTSSLGHSARLEHHSAGIHIAKTCTPRLHQARKRAACSYTSGETQIHLLSGTNYFEFQGIYIRRGSTTLRYKHGLNASFRVFTPDFRPPSKWTFELVSQSHPEHG